MSRTRPQIAVLSVLLLLAARPARAEEWFDAYTRGLDALKQKKGARAAELLERAVRLRSEPGTNILTYGTNRLDEYYPYLHLAQAYLLAGDAPKAREALKRSEDSAREPAKQRAALVSQVEGMERTQVAAATPPPPATASPAAYSAPSTTLTTVAPPPPATVPDQSPPSSLIAPGGAIASGSLPVTGTLELRSTPSGATVLLGDRLLGVTPVRAELAPGAYQVTVREEGTADQSFPVRIVAGRATAETRTLVFRRPPTPVPAAGPEIASLIVFSDPPGASVYLDDEAVGATDGASGRLVKSGVSPGLHRVRLSLSGWTDLAQDVNVAASGPTTFRGSFPPPRTPFPLPTAAIGAVVLLVGLGLGWVAWRRRAIEGPRSTVVLPRAQTTAATRSPSSRPGSAPASHATKVSEPTVEAGPLDELLETRSFPKGSPSATVGERFGDYLLRDQLGKGGMATVFLAERNGELCALKRPLNAFMDDPEFLERFLREAEIGRTLHHPNIIRIFERGDVSGVPYFTMELVKGETLQAYVRREGAFAPPAATRVVTQVAEALDYAHLKGVIHRDLKPSNIMILEDRTVKVMDYGIARARRFEGLTVTGAFLGTPDYVAPEIAEGKGADARSDLYSLGIVFYEILTGKKPFVGDTPFATLRKHCTEAPTRPSVLAPGCPGEVEAIVLRLLAKDPNDRFPGAEELLIELRDYLNRAA